MENFEFKKNIYKISKLYVKMEKTIIRFLDIEIEKQKFHQHKEHRY